MKKIIPVILVLISLAACNQGSDKTKKEDNNASPTATPKNTNGDNRIIFKVNGNVVNTEGWVVQRFVWDVKTPAPWLNITSNMHLDKRAINANLNGTVSGTYEIAGGALSENSHGSFFPDFADPLNSYSFISGSFQLTAVDTINNVVNGIFSGTVKNSEGKTMIISDGQLINVKMKPGITNLNEELKKLN